MVHVAEIEVRDAKMQVERIKTALKHIDRLISDGQSSKFNQSITGDNGEVENGVSLRLIKTCLQSLAEVHVPTIDNTEFESSGRDCDGQISDGWQCPHSFDFETEIYHCVYCADRDFCHECYQRLRKEAPEKTTICGPNHLWVRLPPMGDDLYVEAMARSVPNVTYTAVEGDYHLLTLAYADAEAKRQIMVEGWKETLAKEWEIKL